MTSSLRIRGTASHPLQLLSLMTLTDLVGLAASTAAYSAPRLVVVGKVQGAADSAASLLENVGLIDSGGHWSGGGTPAALEIVDDDFVIVTMKGREILIDSQ